LTGLIPKDAGSIRVYGKSIDTDIDEIRRMTGICPQHDVQYDNLTIEEHLQFYARVKGVPEYEIQNQVEEIIIKCALDE
jgi:ABC-type multidrug transport system ATPase subunit